MTLNSLMRGGSGGGGQTACNVLSGTNMESNRWDAQPERNTSRERATRDLTKMAILRLDHSNYPREKKENDASAPESGPTRQETLLLGKREENKPDSTRDPSPKANLTHYPPSLVNHGISLPKSLRRIVPSLSFHTIVTASNTICRDILDVPAWRSIKIIGTSPILNPFSWHR